MLKRGRFRIIYRHDGLYYAYDGFWRWLFKIDIFMTLYGFFSMGFKDPINIQKYGIQKYIWHRAWKRFRKLKRKKEESSKIFKIRVPPFRNKEI